MRRDDSLATAATLGLIAFAVVYFLAPTGPVYDPVARVWSWQATPGAIAMGWFARLGWSLIAGLGVGGGVAAVLQRLRPGFAVSTGVRKVLMVLTFAALVTLALWVAGHELVQWTGPRGS